MSFIVNRGDRSVLTESEKKQTRKGQQQHVLLDILYLHKHRCWALWVKHKRLKLEPDVSNLSLNQVCTWEKP